MLCLDSAAQAETPAALPYASPPAVPPTLPPAPWVERLQADLADVAAHHRAAIGVYVRDLDTGEAVSHRGDESWYLASTVKVPVAIAVLRGVARGEYTLETTLTVRASDFVDGAGHTNYNAVGTALSLRYLLEQMLIYSDNTASDMLIGLVGIQAVNDLVQSLVPEGFERITTLADVRRHAYSYLLPDAVQLSGHDFFVLRKQRTDADRLAALAQRFGTPVGSFAVRSVGDAFDAYYASGLNSGRLDAFGQLLALLADGQALNAEHTQYLLSVMARVQTGKQRIKAGLPPGALFAHKTGSQRARTCDSGLITTGGPGPGRRVVVAACTRGEFSVAQSDRALQAVGVAICRSGLLQGSTHGIDCPMATPVTPVTSVTPVTAGSPDTDDDAATAVTPATPLPSIAPGDPGVGSERGAAVR
jgi:beta-lactamase class A